MLRYFTQAIKNEENKLKPHFWEFLRILKKEINFKIWCDSKNLKIQITLDKPNHIYPIMEINSNKATSKFLQYSKFNISLLKYFKYLQESNQA